MDFARSREFRAVPPARSLRPEAPAWLNDLVGRCLEFEASQRPASATELLEALDAGPVRPERPRALIAVLIAGGVQHNAYEWSAILGLLVGGIGFFEWCFSRPPDGSS